MRCACEYMCESVASYLDSSPFFCRGGAWVRGYESVHVSECMCEGVHLCRVLSRNFVMGGGKNSVLKIFGANNPSCIPSTILYS